MELKTTLKICFIVVIETIFCFTPLGTIPLGPIAATLSMVPVIIASLTFGKRVGMLVGGVFGIYSFIYWTFIMPAFPTAFLFTPFSSIMLLHIREDPDILNDRKKRSAGPYVRTYASQLLNNSMDYSQTC